MQGAHLIYVAHINIPFWDYTIKITILCERQAIAPVNSEGEEFIFKRAQSPVVLHS
jgi:hypothetical protein